MATIQFTDGTSTWSFDGYSRNDFHLNAPGAPDGGGPVSQLVELVDTTGADARAKANLLNKLFETARQRKTKLRLPRVFFNLRVDDSESYWRSEIYDGIAKSDTEVISDYALGGPVRYPVSWVHAPWWDGPETQMLIANIHGTTNTTALTVNGTTTSTQSSYFIIGGSALAGDMPSPVRLELTNTGANALGNVVIGQFRGSLFLPSYNFLEGESVSSGGGSNVSDPNSSNGVFRRVTWSGTAKGLLFGWTVGNGLLSISDSAQLVPVIRFASYPPASDIYIRFRLFYGTAPLDETPWQVLSTYTQMHVGLPLRFPPQRVNGTYDNHTLYIEAQRISGGSTTLELDFVQLFGTDSFERFTPASYQLAPGSTLVVDDIDNYLYTLSGSSRAANYARTTGQHFTVTPGEDSTFCVLAMRDTGGMEIGQSFGVKAFYRPRRKAI